MIKMNKRNLYWIKYLQVTNNSANSELKYGIDWKKIDFILTVLIVVLKMF